MPTNRSRCRHRQWRRHLDPDPGQLTGLTLTPPSDSDADFTLTVTSTATDGSDTAQTVDTFDVTVKMPSALTDTDGSESLSVVVSGVPTGASLSPAPTMAMGPGP